VKRFEAITNTHAMSDFAVIGKLLLEIFDLSTQDIPSRAHEAKIGVIELSFEFLVGTAEIEKWDFH
jgi:hypothetical protein